jgi:hypothetical protein
MRLRDVTCAFCLNDRAQWRVDVKGRPYLTCTCGTRAFVPNLRDAVRYLATTEPLLRAHGDLLATDKEFAAKTVEREVEVATAFASMLQPKTTTDSDSELAPAVSAEKKRKS